MRCSRCGERVIENEGWHLTLGLSRDPVVRPHRLCARCGGVLRAWLEGKEGEDEGEMPGPDGSRHGLFEDHAEGEGIKADELMADGIRIGYLPKHPVLTESRSDSDSTPKDGSSSPPVASTLYVDRYGRVWRLPE